MKKSFTYDFSRRVTVTIDEAKFSPELMSAFNELISDFGEGEDAFELHAEHIAKLRAREIFEFRPDDFVEGYGLVEDAGITATIHDRADSIERISPEGEAA